MDYGGRYSTSTRTRSQSSQAFPIAVYGNLVETYETNFICQICSSQTPPNRAHGNVVQIHETSSWLGSDGIIGRGAKRLDPSKFAPKQQRVESLITCSKDVH